MSKTCPNCGVNSPDNAKFCIECAYNIEDVPVNKEEVKTSQTRAVNESSFKLGYIAVIAVVVLIAAAGFFIFSSGGDDSGAENLQITFDEVKVDDFISDGKTYYDYWVNGYIIDMPKDSDKYMLKTIYYDSSGKEIASTTEKLSKFKDDGKHDFPSSISFYQTENYLDVDHVSVQLIKDNVVINDFNSTMSTNHLSSANPSTNST